MKKWLDKLDKKKMIKGFALLWGLILIVVMTITNIGLRDEIDFNAWLGDTLIVLGIIVFGLFMGESVGADSQKEKDGGLYQRALYDFNEFIKKIDDLLVYFIQFFSWFSVNELHDKKVNYLIANNISVNNAKKIIKYLSVKDIEKLLEHPLQITDDETGKTIRIGRINKEQEQAVIDVLSGKIKLNAGNPSYYLNAYGQNNNSSILEQGKELEKLIHFNKRANRIIKLSMSLVVSMVFGFLSVKEFMRGDDLQAWANLVIRITSLITSFLSGWLSSVVEIKLQAQQINNKVMVLKFFKNAYDTKSFIPKSEEQLINEELEQISQELSQLEQKHDTIKGVDEKTTENNNELQTQALDDIALANGEVK